MDHNFEDAMNMESIEVDFGEGETVITEGMDHDMVMDFDLNQQKPILMDTTGDAVEYLNDFTLPSGSEYVPQNDMPQNDMPMSSTSVTGSAVVMPKSNPDPVFEMQSFEGQTVVVQSQPEEPSPFVITRPPGRPPRQLAPAPKIVPIAPKPAPSPQSAVQNKPTFKLGNFQMKKLTVSNAIPGQKQVLAQIGKQLVVMPANSGPKFRIIPPGGSGQPMQAQIISGKTVLTGPGHKQILMKIPNIGGSDQPAVLTKIVPQNSAQPSKVITMHPKTVPVNNVMLTSALNRPQQQVNAKQQGVATKKVIITSNAAQSLIRRQAVDGKFITKIVQPKLTTEGQQTQIHQIHVPGKGVQYIRLVTNSNAPGNLNKRPVVVNKTQADLSFTSRNNTFIIDDKGNMVPVTVGNKAVSTATAASSENQIIVTSGGKGSKPAATQNAGSSRKLVRIAPVTSRAMAQPGPATIKNRLESLLATADSEKVEVLPNEQEPHDTKAALQALIEEIVDGNTDSQTPGKSMPDMSDSEGTMDISEIKQESSWEMPSSTPKPEMPKEHPLIVIPPDFYATTPREERKIRYGQMTFDLAKVLEEDLENVEEWLVGAKPKLKSTAVPRSYRREDINSSQDYDIEHPSSPGQLTDKDLDLLKPRKACNCTKSQCLKLYCDCFANGEFCNNCNCNNCHNNLESEEARQKAIRGCLERNPNAFRPKIGKTKATGPAAIRRHNKGCNCKRSGCLKNYCECYEAKIACSSICKCVGCRNVDDRFDSVRRRELERRDTSIGLTLYRSPNEPLKQPCMFMTSEVIDAVCQCLLAAAGDDGSDKGEDDDVLDERDPMKCVIEEFSRCLQDIISASHQPPPTLDETGA